VAVVEKQMQSIGVKMSVGRFLWALASKMWSNRKLGAALFVVAFYWMLHLVFVEACKGTPCESNVPLDIFGWFSAIGFSPMVYRARLAMQAEEDREFLKAFTTTYTLDGDKVIPSDEH
jgi:hypothetical protein